MDERSFATDFTAEAMKGAPPVGIAASTLLGMVDWQTWVFFLTVIYVAMQIIFLGWRFVDKWRGKPDGKD